MNSEDNNKTMSHMDGRRLKAALEAATQCLNRYSQDINSLNVFPVPDGDTGTNMLLTMQSINESIKDLDTNVVATIAKKASHGALYGARGNSGVIFSQFLAGFADALDGIKSCDTSNLAKALTTGSDWSYAAVSEPVEGTMLTVIRELSSQASLRASEGEADIIQLWTAALEGSREALELTPLLLPMLKDAGVVDSGGQGIVVILEGIICSLAGNDVDQLEIELSVPQDLDRRNNLDQIKRDFLQTTQSTQYGFCTEFLLNGENISLASLRANLSEMGTSMIVVGDVALAKIHIHTFDPDRVLDYANTLGKTTQLKVDDIDKEHKTFVDLHMRTEQSLGLGVVSVAWGEGFANLFRDLGCHVIISCNHGVVPSPQEILDAARNTGADEVVILPNNPNVAMAARQACSLSHKNLNYIDTSSMPEAVSALLSYNPELPTNQVLQAMTRASKEVKTLTVSVASKDSIIEGIQVTQGEVIGLLEGTLIAVGDSVVNVVSQGILESAPPSDGVVTLYWGIDGGQQEALEILGCTKPHLPDIDFEAVYGGQPVYHYIVSIE